MKWSKSPDFSRRAETEELMDDLACEGLVVHQTLRELDFINHWLGGNAVTLQALNKVWKEIPREQTITIIDLGCGSGEMLRLVARTAEREKRRVKLIGVDANAHIIDYARRHTNQTNIQFEAIDIFSEQFRSLRADVVLATLFVHHFSNDALSSFLTKLKSQTRCAIIINDIHRHPLAYYSILWLTKLFSRSAMVKYDAPLSVLRAFKRTEVLEILSHAQLTRFKLKWRWAFRWQWVIPTD